MSIHALSADTRSLDQIYEAAQKESGPLIVASGGDGMVISKSVDLQPSPLTPPNSPGSVGRRAKAVLPTLSKDKARSDGGLLEIP